jgi:uncharacterized membrane protein
VPASPPAPPEPRTAPTTGRPRPVPPTTRQVWVRSLVIAAVLALFVAVAFGRFETGRMVGLFVGWAIPLALLLGALFTWLNRPRAGTGG